jgi:redox-sensitive bicupin YhaK (pirin superfamily)
MLQIIRSDDRGHAHHGWLESRHTFSFGDYYDPRRMGFGQLRVINEDRVVPGAGFPTHPHRDMEIVSLVLSGAIEHKDSMGNGSVIRAGDVQRMSAGTGVLHSEYNPSKRDPLHFLQIWIMPEQRGLEPGYEQRTFPLEARKGRLQKVGARDGADGAVTIHQDVGLYVADLGSGEAVTHPLTGRRGWVQVTGGAVTVNGEQVQAGDGVALQEEAEVRIEGTEGRGQILLFDLA